MFENDLQNKPTIDPKQKWVNLINKFNRALVPKQHGLGTTRDSIVDSVRVRIFDNSSYLQEIAQGTAYYYGDKYKMLRMDEGQLKEHQLLYNQDTKRLDNYKGEVATTIGKSSKSITNVQAFVLSKNGELYIGHHRGFLRHEDNNLSHASFLAGIPVEMAGIIGIEGGKIDYISNQSGHYTPDELDMYRCIKKLQTLMPDVFTPDCMVVIMGKETDNPLQFVKRMEAIDEKHKIPYYQQLRNVRIQRIEQGVKKLKKVSERSKDEIVIIKGSGDILENISSLGAEEMSGLEQGLSNKITHIVARDIKQNKSTRYSIHQIITTVLDSSNLPAMQKLLDVGINKRPEYVKLYPLHREIRREDVNMVRLLLKNNEDPNLTDEGGKTPLVLAIERGKEEIVQELLDHGANPDAVDKNGTTTLEFAMAQSSMEVLEKIIKSGVNVNTIDKQGRTPIMKVLMDKSYDGDTKHNIVKLLLENGANIKMRDRLGRTPQIIAQKQSNSKIIKLISAQRAKSYNATMAGSNQKPSHIDRINTKHKQSKITQQGTPYIGR